MGSTLSLRRCIKLEDWPETDRLAWTRGCTPGPRFGEPRPGAKLRPDSLKSVAKGYGRWLGFLEMTGALNPETPPRQRVTLDRLAEYGQHLLQAGNADATIIGRFDQLAKALRIVCPREDVSWIRKPGGVTIYRLLPNRRRPMRAPDASVLFAWACRLMDRAGELVDREDANLQYRDGLLLAVLASRGRRLRSMALLRLGYELLRDEIGYRVELTPDQVKTKRADCFRLPDRLTRYVDRYLEEVRPELLAGRFTDALWVTKHGRKLTARGIQSVTERWTRREFDEGYGPHRFRHAVVTSAALGAPECEGLGAAVLGISAAVAAKHYRLEGTNMAAIQLAELIARKRERIRGTDQPVTHHDRQD